MKAMMALVRLQLRIVQQDPWSLVVLFLMPVVTVPIFNQLVGEGLRSNGEPDATGAEVVVPGQMLLFGFFLAGAVGYAVYREHGWRTWDRLRASAVAPWAILSGFAIPWIAIHILYSLVVLLAGVLTSGLRLNGGSPFAVVLLLFSFSTCLVCLMLLAAVFLKTVDQLSAVQQVGGMVFSGLGGAIIPLESLPGWAQFLAPITPTFWAMQGYRSVFLNQGDLDDVVVSCGVLFTSAVVMILLASVRFRLAEAKDTV